MCARAAHLAASISEFSSSFSIVFSWRSCSISSVFADICVYILAGTWALPGTGVLRSARTEATQPCGTVPQPLVPKQGA